MTTPKELAREIRRLRDIPCTCEGRLSFPTVNLGPIYVVQCARCEGLIRHALAIADHLDRLAECEALFESAARTFEIRVRNAVQTKLDEQASVLTTLQSANASLTNTPMGELLRAAREEIARLKDENAEMRAQLPEGMKDCTILFRECAKGHGWLTATNWVQHECPACTLELSREETRWAREDVAELQRLNAGLGRAIIDIAEVRQ